MKRLRELSRPIEIMLIEDNLGDVFLTQKAFEKSFPPHKIKVIEDGEIAMNILNRDGKDSSEALPDLILMDLNLPKIDGREILGYLKNTKGLKRIPVIILTSSEAENDIIEAYELHVNGYIVKPENINKFSEIVESIKSFWCNATLLPE